MIVEVGGAGTIAQSIAAVAYRGVISLVGHLAHDTTGMNLLDFTYSGATLRDRRRQERPGGHEQSLAQAMSAVNTWLPGPRVTGVPPGTVTRARVPGAT